MQHYSFIKVGILETGRRGRGNVKRLSTYFLEATCDVTFKDLGSFDSTHVVKKLVPKINYDVPIEDVPLLAVQFTKFSCGSLTLGLAMCRAVLDGASAANFINSWAKLTKIRKTLDSSLIPFS
uniref:Transferase, putative n=1 Tax=Medicago truncatula TaxID=3880 RepID=A2Q1H0_MEDTR|nr:Transferase, putative [Medicago truncatula]